VSARFPAGSLACAQTVVALFSLIYVHIIGTIFFISLSISVHVYRYRYIDVRYIIECTLRIALGCHGYYNTCNKLTSTKLLSFNCL